MEAGHLSMCILAREPQLLSQASAQFREGGIAAPQPHTCAALPRLGDRFEFPSAQKKLIHVSCFLIYLQKGAAASNSVAKDALGTAGSSSLAALGLLCSSSEEQGLRHTLVIVSYWQLPR